MMNLYIIYIFLFKKIIKQYDIVHIKLEYNTIEFEIEYF